MKTTIDKAGRVVIPMEIRRRALFEPGTELIIRYHDGVVTISRDVEPPEVVRDGVLLRVRARGDAPELDIDELIRNERDRWP